MKSKRKVMKIKMRNLRLTQNQKKMKKLMMMVINSNYYLGI